MFLPGCDAILDSSIWGHARYVYVSNLCLLYLWESIKLHASTWNIFSFAFAMLDYIAFLCCLEFAVLNSVYQDTVLKSKQVISLESVYLQKDVMCILPTGYGKSLIFHLLPMLLFAKFKLRGDLLLKWRSRSISMGNVNSIVVVVSPLNSLMSDQISRLRMSGVQASVINIKESN